MTSKYRLVHGLNLRLPTDGKMFFLEKIPLDSSEIKDCVDSFVKKVFYQHDISSKNLMVFSFYDPVRKVWLDNRMHEVYINVKPKCIKKVKKAVEKTQKEMFEKRLTINDFINCDIETKDGRNTLCFRINYNSKNEHSIYRLLIKNVKNNWDLSWCEVTEFGDEFDFKNYQHVTDCFIKKFLPKAPGHYGYVFLLTRGEKLYGVSFLYSSEYISKPKLEAMAHDFDVVFRIYLHHYLSDAMEMAVTQACKAAAAAIMARNMSHHIGSHVIPRTTNDLLKKKLQQFFFKGKEPESLKEWRMLVGMLSDVKNLLDDYMCRKAEFIADVTTGPTLSTRSASFFGDVVLPFIQNTALIDTLAANEGFGYPAWNVSSLIIRCSRKSIKGKKNNIPFFPQFSNPDYGSGLVEKIGNDDQLIAPYAGRSLDDRTTVLVPSYKNKEFDMRVALPGSVGEMAFYSILENIIRNAAKYSGFTSSGNTDKKLEVNILISDSQDEPETYRVDIYENLSNPEQEVTIDIKDGNEPKTLVELLKYYVTLDIIDDQGQLRKEAWGIAEIVINACHLRGCPAPDPKSLTIDSLPLSELSGSHGADSDQKRLVYTLRLMKAKTALLVGFNDVAKGVREQLKDEGFIFISNLEDVNELISNRANSLASFQFAVVSSALLKKNNLEPLHEIRHRFPFRVIVAGIDSSQQSLKSDRYAFTDQTPAIENGNDLLIWLWETWLTKLWRPSQEEEKTRLSKYGIDLLQMAQDVLLTKAWVKKADKFNKRCEEKKLPYGLRVWGKGVGNKVDCFTKNKKQAFYRRFILDRHRDFALSSDDPPQKDDNYIILDKSNTDFGTLFSPSFTDPFTLPYELLEAGLLRILVLDERIAQKSMAPLTDTESSKGTVKKVLMGEKDYENYSPVFWHMAKSANIFVATHLIFKKADNVIEKGEFKLAEDAYETSHATFRNEEKSSASKQSCPSLKLIVDTYTSPMFIQVEVEKIGPEIKKFSKNLSDFDMVIIHQGILDRINQQIINLGDDFLDQLGKNIPWLVIESGRGIPSNLKKHHKFVPFSIIERTFHRERISKIALTRTLMELSRNK